MGGIKTHRSHVSGSKRGARYAAGKKDRFVAQAKRLECELVRPVTVKGAEASESGGLLPENSSARETRLSAESGQSAEPTAQEPGTLTARTPKRRPDCPDALKS